MRSNKHGKKRVPILPQPLSLASKIYNLSEILFDAHEYSWSQCIYHFASNFEENMSWTDLKEIAHQGLYFYGGMGTLNDIVLSINGILLIEENNKLDALRTEIHTELVDIVKAKATNSDAVRAASLSEKRLYQQARSSVDEKILEIESPLASQPSISNKLILQGRNYTNDLVADLHPNETESIELQSQKIGTTISIDDLPRSMWNVLFECEFEIVKVDPTGKIITPSQLGNAWGFREPLGMELNLELLLVPGGKFMMGSPDDEIDRSLSESPQHEVTIQPFFIGKYPVTQAQWRFIAGLPEFTFTLDPNSGYFKGDNLPVENISWWEADEFCGRLSIFTGRTYRLPTEAEWEYACRAGTTTPFYFGETISTDLANYDGTDDVYGRMRSKTFGSGSYASGSKGINRAATNPVGEFPPNAFGLADLHGNVMEWCLDRWENDYQGAPIDGRAWGVPWEREDGKYGAPVRGGSWDCNPLDCRSAWRDGYDIDYVVYCGDGSGIGFRVVCEMSTL